MIYLSRLHQLAAFVLSMSSLFVGQSNTRVWNTPAQLSQWIGFASSAQSTPPGVQILSEQGQGFLRVIWKQLTSSSNICYLNTTAECDGSPYGPVLSIMDPTVFNAVQVKMRQKMMGFDSVTGLFMQQDVDYTNPKNIPIFDLYPLPADGQWHILTLNLADSAELRPGALSSSWSYVLAERCGGKTVLQALSLTMLLQTIMRWRQTPI